jgi:hypothetical protein
MALTTIRNLGAVCLLAAISAGAARAQQDPMLAGCWVGTVGAGNQQQRAILDLRTAHGTAHFMGRTLSADTLRDLRVMADSVTFGVGTGDRASTAAGRIETDGVLTGTLARADASRPFRFARAAPVPDAANRLLGYWSGAYESDGAIVLRAGMEFEAAPCGQVYVTLDSPDQSANNLPVTALAYAGDSLRFAMAYLDGAFRGVVSRDGTQITGAWTQGAASLELRLTKGDSAIGRRPQEPTPPYPYDTVAVTYENPADGIRFAGTLTLPPGDGPFPAVLMITGSGAQNRDEAIMGHRPFLVLADHLTRRGVATLRVDDRGVGGSTGNTMSATIADNAGDALAGVTFLQTQPRVDPRRIGLLGHSEGGWVAPLAATRSAGVAFLVLLAAPGVTGEEIRHAQDSVMAVVGGASLDYVAGDRAVSQAIYDALKAERDDSLALVRMGQGVNAARAGLTPRQRAVLDSAWAGVDVTAAWQTLVTPWFRYLLTYDPRPILARVTVPVLAIFGEKDVQVPPAQSVPPMDSAFRAAGNRAVTIRVFPNLNHLFQHATTGLVNEYGRIEQTIAPEVLEAIGEWIGQRFAARPDGR